ncbi:DUF2178 domain-containing protein [Haloarcula salina]|uniref:DUF2178 domain-containing protein n=1 Tax=Haloarcula salina TaxID=1429914 RepID=UPI003C7060BE
MVTQHPVQAGRRYRRLSLGILAVGVVSLFVGAQIGQYMVGLVIYAVAVVGGFALMGYVWYNSSMTLQDEREATLERRASHLTFRLFGYVCLFAFIGVFLVTEAGYYEPSQTVTTLLYAFSAVSLAWGGIYTGLRFRS